LKSSLDARAAVSWSSEHGSRHLRIGAMTYRTMMRQHPEAEFRLEEAAWLHLHKSSLDTIDDRRIDSIPEKRRNRTGMSIWNEIAECVSDASFIG